jgi:hypothetical protein
VGYDSGAGRRYAEIWEASPGHLWRARRALTHADYQGEFNDSADAASERAADEVMYFGYDRSDPYGLPVRRMDAHGGWLGSPTDVLNFLFRADGNAKPADILRRATVTAMTAPSLVRPALPSLAGYGRGWATNSVGTVWHDGTLAGSQTILVRTVDRRAWCALCNAGRPV